MPTHNYQTRDILITNAIIHEGEDGNKYRVRAGVVDLTCPLIVTEHGYFDPRARENLVWRLEDPPTPPGGGGGGGGGIGAAIGGIGEGGGVVVLILIALFFYYIIRPLVGYIDGGPTWLVWLDKVVGKGGNNVLRFSVIYEIIFILVWGVSVAFFHYSGEKARYWHYDHNKKMAWRCMQGVAFFGSFIFGPFMVIGVPILFTGVVIYKVFQ